MADEINNSPSAPDQIFESALSDIRQSAASYPVVFIDHDLIRSNARKNYPDIPFEDAILKTFADEIEQYTGTRIAERDLWSLAGNLDLKSSFPGNFQGSAAWQGQRYANLSPSQTSGDVFCVVKPYNRQVDAHDFTRDFMFFEQYIYGARYHGNPIPTLDERTLPLFVNYHELAHCLDERYAIRIDRDDELNNDNLGESILNRHQSEMFADTLSVLLMAKFHNIRDAGAIL
ncbi:MAG: hypothetical protein EA357_08370, partial [Micavibrio sp.]